MGNKISQSGAITTDELVTLLTGLAEGLKAGRVLFEKGTDFIVLYTCDKVDFKIETKVKSDNAKISITLSWPICSPACEAHSLHISDGTTSWTPQPKKITTA